MLRKFLLFLLCLCLFVLPGCTRTDTRVPTEQNTKYVEVKYRDTLVNLSNPKFEYLNTDKSSFVGGAWYDQNNQYMLIRLRDTYYHYCGLPENVWNNFKRAESFGEYYNQNIKGNFDCRLGKVPAY